jgi:hypothetical protein
MDNEQAAPAQLSCYITRHDKTLERNASRFSFSPISDDRYVNDLAKLAQIV